MSNAVDDTVDASGSARAPEAEVAQPRSSRARWIALAVVALVTVLILVLATRPAADDAAPGNPLVGQPAPEIRATALDGRPIDLQSLRGRYVVVNFFATWCLPCRKEHPELLRFSQQHQGPTSPTIVAVAYDKNDIDAAKQFFRERGGAWPVVPDDGGSTAVGYGVRGLPESYVVDPQGNISAHVPGGVTADTLNRLTGGIS